MVNLHFLLYLAALVLFLIASYPVPTRFNLMALGLACLTLTLLI